MCKWRRMLYSSLLCINAFNDRKRHQICCLYLHVRFFGFIFVRLIYMLLQYLHRIGIFQFAFLLILNAFSRRFIGQQQHQQQQRRTTKKIPSQFLNDLFSFDKMFFDISVISFMRYSFRHYRDKFYQNISNQIQYSLIWAYDLRKHIYSFLFEISVQIIRTSRFIKNVLIKWHSFPQAILFPPIMLIWRKCDQGKWFLIIFHLLTLIRFCIRFHLSYWRKSKWFQF